MKKVGLALAGGGVKGSYEIGAYLAFRKLNIKFNGIVGTSIGAANAAALASGRYKELLKMWKTIDPGALFGIDAEVVKYVNDKKLGIKTFKGAFKTIKDVLMNKGLSTDKYKEIMKNVIDIDALYKNDIDFGLATLNVSKRKPIYIFKEDIAKEDLIDYIMASCSLPVFKLNKSLDNSLYFDGGFFDVCPTNMLIDKQYDVIYEVFINGIGIKKSHKNSNAKIISIYPSRNNGAVLEMNHKKIIDNIYMGYYDTLKVLNKYVGVKYTFKKPILFNYDKALRKVDKQLIKFLSVYYNAKTSKELLFKVLDSTMEKHYDYNSVYNLRKVIKSIKTNNKMAKKFLKGIKLWF